MRAIGNQVNDGRLRGRQVDGSDPESLKGSPVAALRAALLVLHFLSCVSSGVTRCFLGGLASGLANAVFLAAVVTDRVNERSYAHRDRPEDRACGGYSTMLAAQAAHGTPTRGVRRYEW
jgi:hypothetical protein